MCRGKQPIHWDLWLTIAFYLLAGASILAFLLTRESAPRLFVILGCAAIVLRIIYYVKRFIQQ